MISTTIDMAQQINFILTVNFVPLGPITVKAANPDIVSLDPVTCISVSQYQTVIKSKAVGSTDVSFFVEDGFGKTAVTFVGSVMVIPMLNPGTISFESPSPKLTIPT